MMKLKGKALKLKYLYSAQCISWARRITQPTLRWPVMHPSIGTMCLGVCKKDRFRSNLQSNSSMRLQGSEPSTYRLLLLISYCTIKVSKGGANSFPYTGNLKNPHQVAILSWDSFAKLGLEDFAPTMYWNQGGKRNNWFRWFWTQWKIILLYKQNLEAFALKTITATQKDKICYYLWTLFEILHTSEQK